MNTTEHYFLTTAAIAVREADIFERKTMAKVTRRLVPLLAVCYSIAFLDRVNIGFANVSMSKDLALSASAFGGAAGIFFIGYFLFEVPSNLALDKFGAPPLTVNCADAGAASINTAPTTDALRARRRA
jgi:sugar phosphate permease